MEDKILQIKKAMKSVIKSKGLTRLEKYNLVKEKSRVLSESEQDILLKECRRDYESYDRAQDIKELITICLTGIGMLITVFGIFFKEKVLSFYQFSTLIVMVCILVSLSILILSAIQSWRSSNLWITKYMIDILEKK